MIKRFLINILKPKSHREGGFTIVELMIALSILATILLITTLVLIQINSLYDKGINSANLQNTARTVSADVQAALQFNNYASSAPYTSCAGTGSGAQCVTCVGTARYNYIIDRELGVDNGLPGSPTTNHVLWRDNLPTASTPCTRFTSSSMASSGSPLGSNPSGYEMVPNHVRLGAFAVNPTGIGNNLYSLSISVAFGDSDLMTSSAISGLPVGSFGYSYKCNGQNGDQFCASSLLNTLVTGRIY